MGNAAVKADMAKKDKEGGEEKKGGEEKEEKKEGEGKSFKKTFTKKSKKIGRPVDFEDKPFRIDCRVEQQKSGESVCVPINPMTRSLQVTQLSESIH